MNLLSFCRRVLFRSPLSNGGRNPSAASLGGADTQFGQGLDGNTTSDRTAAEQGHAPAQFNLGLLYASGEGVERDDAQARTWICKAAEGGHAAAQHNLGGRCHRVSLGQPLAEATESRIEAYKWLFLASTQGYKGSAAACERVTLAMNHEEVREGNQRAASFAIRSAPSP